MDGCFGFNPNAILLVAFATVVGALAGSTLAGLAIALGILIVLGILGMWDEYDK